MEADGRPIRPVEATLGTHPSIGIHEAYVRGDLESLKRLLGDPPDFPNCRGPAGVGEIVLEYAIYWSPLPFIKQLLELGANPNYDEHAGFPSLIASLSTQRPDKHAIVELLLAFGADIQQRGHNDWTPLHWAAAHDDERGVALLLGHGADPNARTNIDDHETPLEEAERAGCAKAAAVLRKISQS
jgi:ankyrin repeat protein